MNVTGFSYRFNQTGFACLLAFFAGTSFAADNWINPGSGFWKDAANWSAGRPPDSGLGSTVINNANTKTVTIDPSTPAANLVINSLTVAGSGGTGTNTLLLSNLGTNNPLTLINGSELKLTQGGALVVSNSSLVVTGSFGQGFNLYAGTATLESGSLRVVEDPDTTNITVLVRVGRTNAAGLTLRGGVMEAGTVLVGETPFSQYSSQGTVRIEGGLLSLSSELSIAEGARGTGLVEVVGGRLEIANNQTNITRVGNYGVGRMIVSNATAVIGNMSVARHDGALGTLEIRTNSLLQLSDDLSIGRFGGATGAVLVADGQLVVLDHAIWVGREGAGQLAVSSGRVQALGLNLAAVATNTASGSVTLTGGLTLLSSNLVAGSSPATPAEFTIAGGDLVVTNAAADAAIDVLSGAVTLNSGSVTADRLRLAGVDGDFHFYGGILRTHASTVSNGRPFVVGDGVHGATLDLLGGSHSFADGLVISSNATVNACGATITGPVTNFGTLITTCGSGPAAPVLTNVVQIAGSLSFSFDTASGFNYFIEYKARLDDPAWSWDHTERGTGGTLTVTVTIGPDPARFYRVRVQ